MESTFSLAGTIYLGRIFSEILITPWNQLFLWLEQYILEESLVKSLLLCGDQLFLWLEQYILEEYLVKSLLLCSLSPV